MSQTLSGTYTKTITPGTGGYENTLIFDGTYDGGPRGLAKVIPAPTGADGVYDAVAGANLTLDNGSVVYGAAGDSSVAAGVGIDLTASATVTVDAFTGSSGAAGVVGGHNYSGAGGIGVSMTGGGHLYNYGDIFAGFGADGIGATGAVASGGTVVTNTAFIYGGFEEAYNGVGGVGLQLTSDAQLFNSGRIHGGSGFNDENASGGTGVVASGAGVSGTDSGAIYGGDAYGSGHAGVGLKISNDATLVVTGNIHGGNNTNTGTPGDYSPGGQGGAAADIYSGATLTVDSNGYLRGGQGATPGVGVYLDGGTLVNSGVIQPGKDYVSAGVYNEGDAVQFGPAASNLTINYGSVIEGAINGLAVGDTIDATYWTRTGTEAITSSTYKVYTGYTTLNLTGLTPGDYLSFKYDGHGGTDITEIAPGSITVYGQVVIGSAAYPSPLVVGNGGTIAAVAPSGTAGTTAVVSYPGSAGLTVNAGGAITGGTGNSGAVAGNGVSLGTGANVTVNDGGTITGGYGGTNVRGGVGVDITTTSQGLSEFTNDGKISGGAGNAAGGGGVYFSSNPPQGNASNFTNSGNVYGGSGFAGPHIQFFADGGYGVSLAGGVLLKNSGLVKGGDGGVYGGAGLILTQGASAVDQATGSIIGGRGVQGLGGVGVELVGNAIVSVYGLVSGGTGQGGTTGDAVSFNYVAGGNNLEELRIHPGSTLNGDIAGFGQPGSYVDVVGWFKSGDSAVFTSGTYTLDTSDGNLTFTGLTVGDRFAFYEGPLGGTQVTEVAACYRKGTRIAAERGEVAIESLRIGENVLTQSGALRPIRWIGRRTYAKDAAMGNPELLPVLFRRGSLGADIPRRDLWVSPEHAMWIDGMLIPAHALVNGESILQDDRVQEVSYIHIEFDTHDVVLAEGALSESYVDDESREHFDNIAEYCALYPDAPRKPARFCAPRVEDGEALQAVRRRLLELCLEGPAGHRQSGWRDLSGSRSGTGAAAAGLTA